MNSSGPTRLRPEIQALRAAAVLLVVLFHLWPGRLPGGYIGVDVFFVISGFLITSHLWREADGRERISLAKFWSRRARRLLPAAYTVLIATGVAVVLWLPMGQWTQNFREIIASTFYVQNWALAADAVDYLAADNQPTAVQHYWTLSVEEQFYIVWPLLFVLALAVSRQFGHRPKHVLAVVLGITTIASFAYSLWVTSTNPQLAYFATPSRAWQFGAGALFAIWTTTRAYRDLPNLLASLSSWAGFLALAACGLAYNDMTPFPGTAALVPVAAALAIMWAAMPRGWHSPAPLLDWKPVQLTGDMSYSMYLWHWPPLVILPYVLGGNLEFWPRFWILVATFVLSWLTKIWIEDPIRHTRGPRLRQPAIVGLLSVGIAVLVTAGSATAWSQGRQAEAEAAALTAKVYADLPDCFGAASMDPRNPCNNPELTDTLIPNGVDVSRDLDKHPECWVSDTDHRLKSCTFGDRDSPDAPHVVLIGDSHARSMLPAFIRLAELGEIRLTAQMKGGCAWTAGASNVTSRPERNATCTKWKKRVNAWLAKNSKDLDLVVTTTYTKSLSGSPARRASDLAEVWRPVIARGVKVVGLTDNPHHDFVPAECVEQKSSRDEKACAVSRDKAFAVGDPFGDAAELVEGAYSLDLTEFYCTGDICPSVIGGVNVYRDKHHVTRTYARTLVPYILRDLRALKVL